MLDLALGPGDTKANKAWLLEDLIHSSLQQIFTECIYYTKFQVLFNLCLVPSSVKWSFVNQLDLTEMYKWDEYKNNVQNEM